MHGKMRVYSHLLTIKAVIYFIVLIMPVCNFQEEARLKKEAEEKADKERLELEEATQRRARQEEWVSGSKTLSYNIRIRLSAQLHRNSFVM